MYPLFLILRTGLEFSRQIFAKIFKYQCSGKTVQWKPSCFVRTDGQKHRRTDREGDVIQLTVAFENSVNEPKTVKWDTNMQLIYKNIKYTDALDGDLSVYLLVIENTKG